MTEEKLQPNKNLPPPSEMVDPLENLEIKRLQIIIYLLPVIGFFPALWTLYHRNGTRSEQAVSRLSITLAFTWLLGYILLWSGAELADFWSLRLLFINSMFTSGYFLVSLGLMVRLWQRKSPRLPWMSQVAEGTVRKHLS
jgi:cellulose synthase/poly-beta-1,6-N-acetylglucosamine synthase-like glycosyltransferase